MTAYRAKLVGGDPSLDFLNTIHDWTVADPDDHIPTFDAAVRFGEAAGILTRSEAASLATRQAGREMGRLRELRTLLERIFRAVVSETDPEGADLDALAHLAARAAKVTDLIADKRGSFVRSVNAESAGVAVLRWRVVDAAVQLLTSGQLSRVKACPSCGWFFLDTSKNNSRRWCSMEDCGSIDKARRYYRKKRSR
jgi:predicted RNA-binding Zn ribbon-like protein